MQLTRSRLTLSLLVLMKWRRGTKSLRNPVVSESVQTSVRSPDVTMGDTVGPAPASSSGSHGPGEAPTQERLKRVDTDEEMRTGKSDVKKPRVAAIGALTVCELAVCEDADPKKVRTVRCKMSLPWTSLSIAGRSLQELCMQTLSDVAHRSSHGGLGGSGRRDHGRLFFFMSMSAEDTLLLLLWRAAGRGFVPEGTRRRTESHVGL